jgi:hypothetical protein
MTEEREVTVRRAPKFLPFLLTGGAFGLILALLTFFATSQASNQDWPSVLGALLLFFCAIGSLSGLYLATIFDRVNLAKAKRVRATKLEE